MLEGIRTVRSGDTRSFGGVQSTSHDAPDRRIGSIDEQRAPHVPQREFLRGPPTKLQDEGLPAGAIGDKSAGTGIQIVNHVPLTTWSRLSLDVGGIGRCREPVAGQEHNGDKQRTNMRMTSDNSFKPANSLGHPCPFDIDRMGSTTQSFHRYACELTRSEAE